MARCDREEGESICDWMRSRWFKAKPESQASAGSYSWADGPKESSLNSNFVHDNENTNKVGVQAELHLVPSKRRSLNLRELGRAPHRKKELKASGGGSERHTQV